MKPLVRSIILIIFSVTLGLPQPTLAQAPECEFEYTIQAGDWLSKIAEKYYDDILAYNTIEQANNAQADDAYTDIADPDLIEPGWLLCIPSDNDPSTGLQSALPGLSRAELANATYKSEWTQNGTAPLTNGEYSEEVAPGSATMTKVMLTDNIAYGQLNGQDVAVVVLVTDPGGSGTFFDLAVMVNQNETPTNIAITNLGDRVQINSISVTDNQIVVDMVQAGPDDPLCCPTQQVIKNYELQGDQVVELSSQVVESEVAPMLVNTVWRWDQTIMNNDDTFVPDNPNNYNVQFLPDGRVSIQADCNQVGGTYTVEGSSITIETGPTTLVACPPGSLGDQFVVDLNGAAIYSIQGQNLYIDLKFDSGTMQFTAQSNQLAGTSWTVTRYNNGKEAVVSVIIGTEMTATFGEDGRLTGSAGCNDYFTDYTTEGNTISIIGPVGATQKLCAQPEGIMEQEQQYLAALQTVAIYSIRGDTLDLRTADGARAAAFKAAAGGLELGGKLIGQIIGPEGATLPEGTVVEVKVSDVSLADAPSVQVGGQLIVDARQFPINFEANYDPSVIESRNTYALEVRITDSQDKLLFINTRSYPVLTQGHPTNNVDVVVEQVN